MYGYNAYVDFGSSSEQLGLAAVLLLSGLGFLAGTVPGSGPSPSRWGYDVIAARYMAARDPGDRSKSRLPRLPRGVLLALLFAAYPLLKGWCPAFLQQHSYFIFLYICCAISTAAWLLIAFFLQPASVQETFPVWLKHWNWGNVAGFLLLMAVVVTNFVVSAPS